MEAKAKTNEGFYSYPLLTMCLATHVDQKDSLRKLIRLFAWFQKSFLSEAEYAFYQRITPNIVKEINKKENSKEIFESIYQEKVLPCMKSLLQGKYFEAYEQYRTSMLALEEENHRLTENDFTRK